MKHLLYAIIPSYGAYEYVDRTVRSFFATSPANSTCGIYDDAHSGYRGKAGTQKDVNAILGKLQTDFPERVLLTQFPQHGGLIRSLNLGLEHAKDLGCEYVLCGNSDLIFTPGWFNCMSYHLDKKRAHLIGPVSNAAGITAGNRQDVRLYFPDYQVTDDETYLEKVASHLRCTYDDKLVDGPINGFCMLATLCTWWAGAYNRDCVFKPRNDFSSKGLRNPTPLMTLNEDELQGRWTKLGYASKIAVGSFVFHYRSVSRGDRYKKAGWYRMKP
jgi:GT2 family glycosyltransferase